MFNNESLRRALRVGLVAALAFVSGCGSNSVGVAGDAGGNATAVATLPPKAAPTPPDATAVISSGLQGATAIDDNFDIASAFEPASMPGESDEPRGAFRMTCAAGQILPDDPILYPGQTGVSHLHQFWGNLDANANSTYQSLRTRGNTTCGGPADAPVNRTAYWMPAMLDGAGHVVKPDNIQIYYKQVPASSAACTSAGGSCVGLPNGIELVFGYNMKTMSGGPTGSDYYNMHYECWADDLGTPAVNGAFQTLPALVKAGCPAGARLVIVFIVPSCWDGKNLDSADHRSHMSYGTPETGGQVCPRDHPFMITAWQGQVRFTTDDNFVAGKWHLSSDDMVPGAPAGSTLHFDYFEAWSPATKAIWQRNCVDAHRTCADGQLGDGRHIKTVVLPPPHQLVTI